MRPIAPTTGGDFKVCLMGNLYRYQETLSGGAHRWKCFTGAPRDPTSWGTYKLILDRKASDP